MIYDEDFKNKLIIVPDLRDDFGVIFSTEKNPDRKLVIDRSGINSGWMYDIPDLTDQQREQIKQIRLNALRDILPLSNELREKRAQLQTFTTGKADIEAAEQVAEEIGSVQAEMMKKRLNSRQQIRELLTDNQRVIYDSQTRHRKITAHSRMGAGEGAVIMRKQIIGNRFFHPYME